MALKSFGTADWPTRMELVRGFEDRRLRYLGLRLAMIEQPELFEEKQLSDAADAIKKKWQHCPDSGNGWSTYESIEADLAEVELRGLVNAIQLDEMRSFFARRRVEIEAGGLIGKLSIPSIR